MTATTTAILVEAMQKLQRLGEYTVKVTNVGVTDYGSLRKPR